MPHSLDSAKISFNHTKLHIASPKSLLSFPVYQIKKAAQKRKEEDADFEEKRMVLGITAEDNEDENDKENLTRRREMLRNRVEKELIVDEDDARYRRGGDIVSRWRDKRPTSPMHYKVSQDIDNALTYVHCSREQCVRL